MSTHHKTIFGNANLLDTIKDGSIALVVTSPPYPMIEMWDEIFSLQNPKMAQSLKDGDGNSAFELMHRLLDSVWDEVFRVLCPGGFACINMGDATRTLDKHFKLYPNHARILAYCQQIGFTTLPAIIWRKQTNAPNKFMGSGMLPAGAYVTLEHEYILILRKGNKREFKTPEEKLNRNQSALFWEERNVWFSDVWFDLKGTQQQLNHDGTRERSGAFPFQIPYRLINMFSVRGDTVLDPFLGSGTTMLAAIASNRNSIGIEIDRGLSKAILETTTKGAVDFCNRCIKERLDSHLAFVEIRKREKGESAFKHKNKPHAFPVMTKQEIELKLDYLKRAKRETSDTIIAEYTNATSK